MVKPKENSDCNSSKHPPEPENDSSSSSDTDPANIPSDIPAGSNIQVFSRSEAKARKQILKHGLKKIDGVLRVTFTRTKSTLFVVINPEVYKMPSSDIYIVFGQIKVEDIGSRDQLTAAQQLAHSASVPPKASLDTPKDSLPEDDDAVDLDDTDLSPKDIELVMDQTKVSRARAVRALRENDGDIVNAIMSIAI
ncbi:unnamed protein product [Pneumocystis jirovecii]|uniref:Nascent polypeptide-associated complex subunit alpha n=2 Tax=Pneumocystis jirovecii TaxID=42068 RepID=L0PAA1_PNEJI|nr:uncharacterized protein T551_03389 [Pneumocystis jirovecii RU7]KTW26927.1 hypothetical protein T551_03389 [Pneumocystis jirovecii RU7]CCJ29326.1 unnamed protein product [Pneumocystis jirovecii]